VDRQELTSLGEVRTPSIADVFVAVMGNMIGNPPGQAQASQGAVR
jgi:hypothetical protein